MLNLSRRAALTSGAAAPFFTPSRAKANIWWFLGGMLFMDYQNEKDKNRAAIATLSNANVQSRGASAPATVPIKYRVVGASALPTPDPDQPENPLLPKLQERFHGDKEIAAHVLNAMGDWSAKEFLADRLGLWTQRVNNDEPNMLVLRIHNNSAKPVRSQLEYTIEKWATRRLEFEPFLDDGYKLDGYGNLQADLPLRLQFTTPGLRRVSVINQPLSVAPPSAFVYVLPFTIEKMS